MFTSTSTMHCFLVERGLCSPVCLHCFIEHSLCSPVCLHCFLSERGLCSPDRLPQDSFFSPKRVSRAPRLVLRLGSGHRQLSLRPHASRHRLSLLQVTIGDFPPLARGYSFKTRVRDSLVVGGSLMPPVCTALLRINTRLFASLSLLCSALL